MAQGVEVFGSIITTGLPLGRAIIALLIAVAGSVNLGVSYNYSCNMCQSPSENYCYSYCWQRKFSLWGSGLTLLTVAVAMIIESSMLLILVAKKGEEKTLPPPDTRRRVHVPYMMPSPMPHPMFMQQATFPVINPGYYPQQGVPQVEPQPVLPQQMYQPPQPSFSAVAK